MFRRRAKILIERETALDFAEAVYPMDPSVAISTLLDMVIDGKIELEEQDD